MLSVWILLTTVYGGLAASPFLSHPKNTYVKLGGEVKLSCKVKPGYKVIWLANSTKTADLVKDHPLTIKGFQRYQQGEYRCLAKKVGSSFSVLSKAARVEEAYIDKMEQKELNIVVTTKNYAIIRCKVPQSKPEPEIYYELNKRRLDIDQLKNHFLMDDGYLHIVSVTEKNSGRYVCFSRNPVTGTVRSGYATNLAVEAPTGLVRPSFYRYYSRKISIIEGEQATIPCCIESVPPPVIGWGRYPNGFQLPHPRILKRLDNALHIKKVITDDQGYYMCHSADLEQSTFLEVLIKPKVSINRSQIYETSGTRNVQIRCNVRGVPEPKVKWYVNGKLARRRGRKLLKIKRTTIIIEMVKKSDEGYYQCEATSKIGTDIATTFLNIDKASPPETLSTEKPSANFRRKAKLISGPSNMTVFEGESLTLKCTAVHFKNLVWVFNGRPVKHGVSLEELHIEKVNKSHEGQYTCYIWGSKRNTQTIEARAYVSVKEPVKKVYFKPNKPTLKKVGRNSVKVRWEIIEKPKVSLDKKYKNYKIMKITSFTLQYRKMKGKHLTWTSIDNIDKEKREYVIEYLDMNRFYKVRVHAIYEDKTSKNGPLSRIELKGQRKTVFTLDKVETSDDNNIHLYWTLDGIARNVKRFNIFYKPASSDYKFVNVSVPKSRRHALITNINLKHSYSFKICTVNADDKCINYSRVINSKRVGIDGSQIEAMEPEKNWPKKSSSELLYLVLGIVLGTLLVLIVIFGAMCAWRQRRQRQMDNEENLKKFSDTSRELHSDSIRKSGSSNHNGLALTSIGYSAPSAQHEACYESVKDLRHPDGLMTLPNGRGKRAVPPRDDITSEPPNYSSLPRTNYNYSSLPRAAYYKDYKDYRMRITENLLEHAPPPPPPNENRPLHNESFASAYQYSDNESTSDNEVVGGRFSPLPVSSTSAQCSDSSAHALGENKSTDC